ncbi:Zn-finger protein [Phytophthora cinnamomi]|uniref:Zn-finger protein n=1 Tax=Phytophthora cinnamomi TaxID=4785 RepID=UPI00355A1C2C|nr:Zn-finger protein [Phytophthora cinnamomi]
MQRRPKRGELPALLARLNDSVGVSARRLFAQQASPSQLLQRSQSELRRLLPELCALVDSLPAAASALPAPLVRRAFRHPDAQWLSRSARQSGISALLCQQLLRLARQQDGDDKPTLQWSVAELALRVLLDALLSPCALRLGQAPDACKWRPLKDKPRFHAMTCFPVWSTLLPFAALAALRYPQLFRRVLAEYAPLGKKGVRVNCDFAQLTGLWRLVEEINRGDQQKLDTVSHVMTSLLRLASDKLLLCAKNGKDELKLNGAHLDDQLLEKFFTGLQGFSFNCWRANAVIKPAVFEALKHALAIPESRAKTLAVPQRVVVFTAVGSMLVKNLAGDVVSMLIDRIRDTSGDIQGPLLSFLVGFCAHLDLVPILSVLQLLDLLLTSYKAVTEDAEHPEAQRQRRLELLFYILYVALHRCQAVDRLRQEVSSEAAVIKEELAQFQMRLCSEIVYEDFYVAAPVHWTARVWKHWVFLTDDDVQAFVTDAHENDNETEEEFKNRVASWQAWEEFVAFRPPSFALFMQMKALLKPHLISSSPLTDVGDDNGLVLHARKRRRTGETAQKAVDPEKLERAFDVLLLPDVMERVCSFMSAKRLCRMALVCRDFAALSHRASLWRPLYLSIGVSAVTTKRGVLPASLVKCSHGDSYEHDWRQLYQARWKVLRRLRRTQRRAIEAAQSSDQGIDAASPGNTSAFVPQICPHCCCDQVLKTASDWSAHLARHAKFTCSEPSCRASLLGLHKFKQHMRAHTDADAEPAGDDANTTSASAAPRLQCGYKDCKKTYVSATRLASHRRSESHFDSGSDTD